MGDNLIKKYVDVVKKPISNWDEPPSRNGGAVGIYKQHNGDSTIHHGEKMGYNNQSNQDPHSLDHSLPWSFTMANLSQKVEYPIGGIDDKQNVGVPVFEAHQNVQDPQNMPKHWGFLEIKNRNSTGFINQILGICDLFL
jgi:hypothetical protein